MRLDSRGTSPRRTSSGINRLGSPLTGRGPAAVAGRVLAAGHRPARCAELGLRPDAEPSTRRRPHREAQAFAGMRVLLACRQFDIDNDHRLQALADEAQSSSCRSGR